MNSFFKQNEALGGRYPTSIIRVWHGDEIRSRLPMNAPQAQINVSFQKEERTIENMCLTTFLKAHMVGYVFQNPCVSSNARKRMSIAKKSNALGVDAWPGR
jgi:hypothetical protein